MAVPQRQVDEFQKRRMAALDYGAALREQLEANEKRKRQGEDAVLNAKIGGWAANDNNNNNRGRRLIYADDNQQQQQPARPSSAGSRVRLPPASNAVQIGKEFRGVFDSHRRAANDESANKLIAEGDLLRLVAELAARVAVLEAEGSSSVLSRGVLMEQMKALETSQAALRGECKSLPTADDLGRIQRDWTDRLREGMERVREEQQEAMGSIRQSMGEVRRTADEDRKMMIKQQQQMQTVHDSVLAVHERIDLAQAGMDLLKDKLQSVMDEIRIEADRWDGKAAELASQMQLVQKASEAAVLESAESLRQTMDRRQQEMSDANQKSVVAVRGEIRQTQSQFHTENAELSDQVSRLKSIILLLQDRGGGGGGGGGGGEGASDLSLVMVEKEREDRIAAVSVLRGELQMVSQNLEDMIRSSENAIRATIDGPRALPPPANFDFEDVNFAVKKMEDVVSGMRADTSQKMDYLESVLRAEITARLEAQDAAASQTTQALGGLTRELGGMVQDIQDQLRLTQVRIKTQSKANKTTWGEVEGLRTAVEEISRETKSVLTHHAKLLEGGGLDEMWRSSIAESTSAVERLEDRVMSFDRACSESHRTMLEQIDERYSHVERKIAQIEDQVLVATSSSLLDQIEAVKVDVKAMEQAVSERLSVVFKIKDVIESSAQKAYGVSPDEFKSRTNELETLIQQMRTECDASCRGRFDRHAKHIDDMQRTVLELQAESQARSSHDIEPAVAYEIDKLDQRLLELKKDLNGTSNTLHAKVDELRTDTRSQMSLMTSLNASATAQMDSMRVTFGSMVARLDEIEDVAHDANGLASRIKQMETIVKEQVIKTDETSLAVADHTRILTDARKTIADIQSAQISSDKIVTDNFDTIRTLVSTAENRLERRIVKEHDTWHSEAVDIKADLTSVKMDLDKKHGESDAAVAKLSREIEHQIASCMRALDTHKNQQREWDEEIQKDINALRKDGGGGGSRESGKMQETVAKLLAIVGSSAKEGDFDDMKKSIASLTEAKEDSEALLLDKIVPWFEKQHPEVLDLGGGDDNLERIEEGEEEEGEEEEGKSVNNNNSNSNNKDSNNNSKKDDNDAKKETEEKEEISTPAAAPASDSSVAEEGDTKAQENKPPETSSTAAESNSVESS